MEVMGVRMWVRMWVQRLWGYEDYGGYGRLEVMIPSISCDPVDS